VTNYVQNNLVRTSWQEYGEILEKILKDVKDYISKNELKIDAVIPILRGGATLGTFLAYRLHVLRVLPVQYKYFFVSKNKAELHRILFTLEKQMFNDKPTFLLVEGDQCFGSTVINAAKDLKELFPKCKIIHVADCLDYSYRGSVKEYVDVIIHGKYTNHCEELSDAECKKLGIGEATIAPWENHEEETPTLQGEQFEYLDLEDVKNTSVKKAEFEF